MNIGENLQECATRLHKMFEFHMHWLRTGLNEASDLEIFFSKIFEKENYKVSLAAFFHTLVNQVISFKTSYNHIKSRRQTCM